ncbi:RNA-binding protein 28 [Harpegnathos saltator]|uniref:RNA-binding protein 28 n=1 Tax=Harpegnathos saltator TaxID=610380 RepID=E2BEV7_HARSA|nr:RNA-binding protein 28 [Harpegnathos saltator]
MVNGCAFVQFDHVQSAVKAIHYANMQLFLNRTIVVDWAVLKNKFLKNITENNVKPQIKIESVDKDDADDWNAKIDRCDCRKPSCNRCINSDMAKHMKLEQWKSQILRNLNMFVSRVRFVVHNLPLDLDDAQLIQLFKDLSGFKAIIKEARVMHDSKKVDTAGRGKSKEYGFVTFTTHEDALKALRSINNPNIFSKNRVIIYIYMCVCVCVCAHVFLLSLTIFLSFIHYEIFINKFLFHKLYI